jgi:hypothetical protein
MEIRKRFSITFTDYTDFVFFHNKNKLILTPVILIIMIPLIWFIVGVIDLGEDWGLIFQNFSSYWLFLLAPVFAFINFFQIKAVSKRQYNSSRQMQVENELVVDDTGVRESNEFGNTNAKWADIFKVAESKKAYYIYFSRLQAFILSKKYMDSGEIKAVSMLIKAHLTPKKYRLQEDTPMEY